MRNGEETSSRWRKRAIAVVVAVAVSAQEQLKDTKVNGARHVAEGRVLAWITRQRYGKRFHSVPDDSVYLYARGTKAEKNAANAVTCRG